jgi:hypothetical protein
VAVKCSCGYVNHNPDARSCELCHAKLKPAGGAASKLPDSSDDLAQVAAAAALEEEAAPKPASKQAAAARKASAPKQETAPSRPAGAGVRGGASGLDVLLFALSFPVSFPAALFVLLKSHDWMSVPVTVWIAQGMLALTAALGAALSVGPGSPAWLVAVLPLTLLSALAGGALLVRVGEKGAGWGTVGAVLAACCIGSGVVLATRAGPVFEGHREQVRAIDVSRDGKRLATVAEDGALRVFEVETRQLQRTTPAHMPVATGVRFDANGTDLVTAGSDGFASFWDLTSDAAAQRIEAHRGGVTDVDVTTPAGTTDVRLLTSGVDGVVRVWSKDGETVGTLTRHKGAVTTVAWSPDGARIASGGTDGVVFVWTPGSGALALEKHKGPVSCVAWAPDGQRLVSGGEDRTIWVWDLSEKKEPPRVLAGGGGVRAVAVFPKGKRMVSAHDSRALVLWDLDRGVVLGERELPAIGTSIAISPDGAQVFVATGRTVRVLDVADAFPAP